VEEAPPVPCSCTPSVVAVSARARDGAAAVQAALLLLLRR
jgi:hypothetical protein